MYEVVCKSFSFQSVVRQGTALSLNEKNIIIVF